MPRRVAAPEAAEVGGVELPKFSMAARGRSGGVELPMSCPEFSIAMQGEAEL